MEYGPGRRRHFSYDQAADLMREFNAGGITAHALSVRHGIDSNAMRRMLAGKTYSDVWLTVQRERDRMIVDWSDPPPARNPGPANTPRETLADLISLLKAHPGRWAWVKTVKKKPNLSWWHKSGLEAQMRKIEGGWRVYARWPEEEPFLS